MSKLLDSTDEHLITLLRENSRMPLVSLAKKINLSRSATQERLQRLERHNIIARYTIQFGPSQDTSVRAWLSVRFLQGFRCNDVVPHILQRPEVRICHSIAGDIDLLILIETESFATVCETRNKIAAIAGVGELRTAPVMAAHFG
ncbi:MAG: Lrp/AsnC family transcriptional regulator [Terricaulis sp.]